MVSPDRLRSIGPDEDPLQTGLRCPRPACSRLVSEHKGLGAPPQYGGDACRKMARAEFDREVTGVRRGLQAAKQYGRQLPRDLLGEIILQDATEALRRSQWLVGIDAVLDAPIHLHAPAS